LAAELLAARDEFLHQEGRVIASLFEIEGDAREGRGAQIAEGLVIIDPQEGDFLRNPQAGFGGNIAQMTGEDVIAGQDGDGLWQMLEPVY